MKSLFRFCSLVLAVLAIAFIAGCSGGGGGGGGGATATGPAKLTGTVAKGVAVPNATVTIKDAKGATKSATTATDGSYQVDVTGMTAPLLIRANIGGTNFYSIAMTASGIANVSPYTDLLLRNWFKEKGTDADTVFASTGPLPALPGNANVTTMEGVVRDMLTTLLQSVHLDPATFNLITSPFAADGTGFDNVLDRTNVAITSTTATVKMVDPNTGASGDIILNIPLGTNLSSAGTNSVDEAKDAINVMLAATKNTMNAKGCSLTGADLDPYLEPGYLNNGSNDSVLADNFKLMMGCPNQGQFTDILVTGVNAYDEIAGTLNGATNVLLNNGIWSLANNIDYIRINGNWLVAGNGKIAKIFAGTWAAITLNQAPASKSISCGIYDTHLPPNIIAATVTGPVLSSNITTEALSMMCDNGGLNGLPSCGNASIPDATRVFQFSSNYQPAIGTVLTITLTKTDNTTVVYTSTVVTQFGFDTNGNAVPTDYPTIKVPTPPPLSKILNGTPTVVSGSVYLPTWSTDHNPPYFNFFCAGNNCSIANTVINGTWTGGTPLFGQDNGFTLTIPAVTSVTPVVINGVTYYDIAFQGQTGRIWGAHIGAQVQYQNWSSTGYYINFQ